MADVMIPFFLTFIAGFSTMFGAIFIFFKDKRGVVLPFSLAFAAGVMFFVSFFDLIVESLLLFDFGIFSFVFCFCFVVIGMVVSYSIDFFIPDCVSDNGIFRIGIFSMVAIVLHNIPEGIATFLSSYSNVELGIMLTVAIALHNIPEGISVSVPIYKATGSRIRALIYTFVSGMSEPLGAVLAYLVLTPIINDFIMGCLLSVVAGIMIHISMFKLFPTSFKYGNGRFVCLFFIFGVLFMFLGHFIK